MASRKTVCVVGVWHLGIINAVGFAEQGFRVIGLDLDRARAGKLRKGTPPLFEPGLEQLMHKHMRKKHLLFSHDPKLAQKADWIVIAYDSPVNDKDEVSVEPIVHAATTIAKYLQPLTPVIITSQMPLGSSEQVEVLIRKKNPSWQSGVVYTPENLKLGDAINRFVKPDVLVFGSNHSHAKRLVSALYKPFRTKKLWTDLRTAEMVKHALNTYLATSISFINEIAHMSDQLGADAVAVGQALRLDKRIGKKALLTPGLGFSGGTLARDVRQLQKFSRKLQYDSKLIDAVMDVNERTFDQVVAKITQTLGTIARKKIGILGLTYKPGTSTLRRSPAITLMQMLAHKRARCFGYDPMADRDEVRRYTSLVTRVASVGELAARSDTLVLVTEWPEFQKLPFATLASRMKNPIMVDTKNALNPHILQKAGFTYIGFGRYGEIEHHL